MAESGRPLLLGTASVTSNSLAETRLRIILAAVEVALGLFLISNGVYAFIKTANCPATAHDCEGWGMLTGVLFIYPGIGFLIAGLVSHFVKKLSVLWVQVFLIMFLIGFLALFSI